MIATIDSEQAKKLVANAIALGLIKPSPPPATLLLKAALKEKVYAPRPPSSPSRFATRECPTCHRMIKTVYGVMINHRSGVDRRGYANGAWCDYSEVSKTRID